MKYYLLKTEPSDYSIDDLMKDQTTIWDGVHNYEAINNIKAMKIGDHVFIYHSVKEKKVVGLGEVIGEPFENKNDPRFSWAVEIKFLKKLNGPTLADYKALPYNYGFKLVTHSRLSVVQVPNEMAKYTINY